MVTLQQVADKAGVSLSTASRVVNGYKNVNEDTRRKVFQAIQDLNFVIYESKHFAQRKVIATVIPKKIGNNMDLYNITYKVLSGITRKCNEAKICNMLILTEENDFDFSEVYSENIGAFIFVSSGPFEENTVIPLLQNLNVPIVVVNREMENKNISFVDVDDKEACKSAVDYLIGTGHKKIAYVNRTVEVKSSNEKLEGYKEALLQHNIQIDDSLVHLCEEDADRAAEMAVNQFVAKENMPDAIMTDSDILAIAIISQLKKKGISVPEDISVIGIGDMESTALFTPSLTTVRFFAEKMGEEATDIVIRLTKDKERSSIHSYMKYELVKRESVKERK